EQSFDITVVVATRSARGLRRRREQSELFVVAQRPGRHAGSVGHLADPHHRLVSSLLAVLAVLARRSVAADTPEGPPSAAVRASRCDEPAGMRALRLAHVMPRSTPPAWAPGRRLRDRRRSARRTARPRPLGARTSSPAPTMRPPRSGT